MPHQNRARKRYGHQPGHIRDAFHAAVEAFGEWGDGEPEPFVDFEVNYRARRISLAQACGLIWGCTDNLGQQGISELDMNGIELAGKCTYAAAARAMLDHLKEIPGGVSSVRDAQLEQLYDRRDRHAERLEIMLGVRDLGKPPADLDRIERMRVRIAAERMIEQWQKQPGGAVPGGDENDAIARELTAIAKLHDQISAIEGIATDPP